MNNGVKAQRLALTMVVRNCAPTLEPLLAAMRPYVDQIIIGLGGPSKDATSRIAKKYADAVVPCGEFFPKDQSLWNFSGARNKLLPLVTATYWMWLDGDDSIDHPELLPQTLDAMDKASVDRVDMVYEYAHDEKGNLLTEHQRERIMRTAKPWVWRDPVHETACCDVANLVMLDDTIRIIHRRDGKTNSSARNLPILLRMMEENPTARGLYHLANAYFSLNQWEECIFYYQQHMEQAGEDGAIWSAAVMAARASIELNDYERCRTFAMTAAAVCPQYADAYVLLATAEWYANRDVEKTEAWIRAAESASQAPLALFRAPLDNAAQLWDVEHKVYASRNQWQAALDVCEHALKVTDSKDWMTLCQFYRECVHVERSRAAALQLADHLIRHGDVVRAKGMLGNFLPSTIRDDPAITAAQNRVHLLLSTNSAEDYESAEGEQFYHDENIEEYPRYNWYVDRLKATGAKKVLEVGCHVGVISRHLAKLGFECVGVDFNPKAIERAAELAQGSARFVCGRLEDITEKFDAVLMAEILEHVTPTVQMSMLTCAETLAPVVLGSVPAEPIGMCPGLYEKNNIGPESFRPHIFEFDQNDMETLILTDPDRRIVNCFKLPDTAHDIKGYANRVFEFDRAHAKRGMGVAFVLGPGHEMWTPLDIEGKGVGGSETAAVRLANELAARGHFVTVYGPETGVYNGVVYRDWKRFDPTEERDMVIISRDLYFLKERPNAAIVALWCHDIAYGDGDFTPEIASRVDKIVVMSKWQKALWEERYDWLDAEKIVPIGNAITLYDTSGVERQRHRFIYSSSPDRGLDDILLRWPLIREMGDAELHVYYGWQYLDGVPELREFKRQVLQLSRQEGVFMHGRIGQAELAKEFARSQFWLYPSMLPRDLNKPDNGPDFHETFCITALEAQAYGCIPVTRAVGAISERLPDDLAHYVDPWVTGNILAKLQTFDELPEKDLRWLRAEMRENAEKYTWKSVADSWLVMIATLLTEKFGALEEVEV
jgi:glycosyltransferase involved in cell wall biosynthesis